MLDNTTQNSINSLHPKIKDEVQKIAEYINSSVLTGKTKLRITEGFRSFERQNQLYNQRPKVTNAKGGQSIHQYGLAFDMTLVIDGKELSWDTKKDWDNDKKADWIEVVEEFRSKGYKWGGDWVSFKDMPHFEKTFGYNVRELLTKYNKNDFIKGTKFVRI